MARTGLILRPRGATGLGLVLLLTLLPVPRARGEETSRQDPPPISARPDTTLTPASQDTLQTPGEAAPERRQGTAADSMQADYTTLRTDGEITTFRGSVDQVAWVRVGNMELTAGIIIYDHSTEQLTALPLPDTTAEGQMRLLHRPVFRQGDQQVVGDRMMWDMVTEKGSVWGADTAFEQGFYHGERINALTGEPDYLTVRDASFTTCDAEHPHYYFSAEQMKIVPEDKVIAKGIRFNLLGIPIPPPLFTIPIIDLQVFPALPFIVKSIRSGRQSGLLMPKYSNNSLTGVTLNDIGYYWAPSAYLDTRFSADVTEKAGLLLRNRTRYAVRYQLQGNVEGIYNYDRRTGVRRWETRFSHTHELDPTLRIVAQGNFSSTSSFNRQLSDDLQRRLERVLRSHVNIAKRFESGANLSATLSRTQYLDQGTTATQFPSLTFRVPRRPVFGSGTTTRAGQAAAGGLRGLGLAPPTESGPTIPRWYENLYVDYGLQVISQGREVKDAPQPSPTTPAPPDTTITDSGIEQRATMTYTGKVGWLNLQPNISLREAWFFGDSARDGFQRRNLWSLSLRGSTKLYGMVDRPLGIDASFRHVLEPSLSLNYAPDFRDLPTVPGLFGQNPGPQRTLAFSLGQLFQMKRQVGEQERRTDLARINTSGRYNAESPTRKLSDLNSSLVMNPSQLLSLQLSMVHSFYAPGTDELGWTPIAQSASYRSSFRLDSSTLGRWLGLGGGRGEEATGAEEQAAEETTGEPEEEQPFGVPTAETSRLIRSVLGGARGTGRLWSLSLSHDYGWSRGVDTDRHSVDGSITFNLPKWTITWSARYDFARREMVRQQFTIFRDLHCWEARLQLVPTGPGRGYWFVIAIKEIPEIKYERRRTLF